MNPPNVDVAADAYADATDCQTCGRENCEGHDTPPDADTSAPPRPSRPRWATEVMRDPPPVHIIDGVSWRGWLTVLTAESGAGKTFVLLDAAAAVSAGVAWHGRPTRQGTVAYCSFEGDALGLRLRALTEHQGRTVHNLAVLRLSEPISPLVTSRDGEQRSRGEHILADELAALQETITREGRPPLGLVIIDTVRASMTGSEDSSEHVAAYLRVARRQLTLVPEAGGILAHHSGWQDGETKRKRERGSSAFRGNVDASLYLEAGASDADRGEAALTLRTVKARDTELPPPLHLLRQRVELADALDADDLRRGARTSCVITRDPRTYADIAAEQAAAAAAADRQNDRAVLQAMAAHRAATSITTLRPYLRLRCEVVTEAVTRILTAGWAVKGTRGQPYTITPAGLETLSEAANP